MGNIDACNGNNYGNMWSSLQAVQAVQAFPALEHSTREALRNAWKNFAIQQL